MLCGFKVVNMKIIIWLSVDWYQSDNSGFLISQSISNLWFKKPCSVKSTIIKVFAGNLLHMWFSRGQQKAHGQPLKHWLLVEVFSWLIHFFSHWKNKKKLWVSSLWPSFSYFHQIYDATLFFFNPGQLMHSREERKGGGEEGEACLLLPYI